MEISPTSSTNESQEMKVHQFLCLNYSDSKIPQSQSRLPQSTFDEVLRFHIPPLALRTLAPRTHNPHGPANLKN
jgi:hypothetical protein